MSEENKRVVRRYFEELDRRKATPVDLCADRFTFYVAGFPPMDLEATKQFAATFFNALPDLSHPNGQVAEFWVSPDRMTLMQQIGAVRATNLPARPTPTNEQGAAGFGASRHPPRTRAPLAWLRIVEKATIT